jgi:hypothetical protein
VARSEAVGHGYARAIAAGKRLIGKSDLWEMLKTNCLFLWAVFFETRNN